MRLLHDLTKKEQKWKWRIRFTTELILVTLDLDRKMRMKVDTLDYAIGEVLSMKCKDGKWRLVAFLSKSLNKIEMNYVIRQVCG